MAKTTYKRRVVKKNPPIQRTRPEDGMARKQRVNWGKWAVIVIAVLISISMILSLFATYGTTAG